MNPGSPKPVYGLEVVRDGQGTHGDGFFNYSLVVSQKRLSNDGRVAFVSSPGIGSAISGLRLKSGFKLGSASVFERRGGLFIVSLEPYHSLGGPVGHQLSGQGVAASFQLAILEHLRGFFPTHAVYDEHHENTERAAHQAKIGLPSNYAISEGIRLLRAFLDSKGGLEVERA